MGGGTDYTRDVPRRRSTDLLQAVASMSGAGPSDGGSLATAAEFCARTHEVAFEITAKTVPAPGDAVTLTAGDPPALLNGGGYIGVLSGRDAAALNGCLTLDWEMTGSVTSVDPARDKGTATLTGSR